METLKEWMYEMVETVPVNSSPLVDDEMLGELDEDSYYPTPLTLQASSSNMSNGSFDETLAFTHPPVSAPYSTYEVLPSQLSSQMLDVNSQFPSSYDYVSSSQMNASFESSYMLSSQVELDTDLDFSAQY
jgi:hypothetical protein